MLLIISLILLSYIFYCLYQYFFPTPVIDPKGKYVLVSGCDTGVGHGVAIELDKQGFNVLAGVYLEDGLTSLKNKLSPKATVFRLDITKQDDIDQAYELVKTKTNTLHALVNNAGIIAHGSIDWTSMEVARGVMDVNYFGHVAMTKKFLPLLITKRHSRVVNMSSGAGFFSVPNTCAYSASKHALEAFFDCLRREMFPWGLYVSLIEPGTLRTTMTEGYANYWQTSWNELSIDIQERWGIDYLNGVINMGVNSPFVKHADDPNKVVQAIQHGVMSKNPHIRYHPAFQGKLLYILYWLPVWLNDFLLSKALYLIPAGVRNQQRN